VLQQPALDKGRIRAPSNLDFDSFHRFHHSAGRIKCLASGNIVPS
jgi:hypothetical protein